MPGNDQHEIKIAIAPISFYWSKNEIYDFYADIAQSAADIVYIGETVCHKRRALRFDDWLMLATTLRDFGKEVVLSTLTLIESESELNTTKRLVESGDFQIECNDMAAVHFAVTHQLPFIAGPAINIYNHHTLQFLISQGLTRWIPSIEQSQEAVLHIINALDGDIVETEIFSYGYLPLAYSARCFTARQYQYPKDDCQFICQQHPQGITLHTQEGAPLFRINGIQTQSFEACNLLPLINEMQSMHMHSLRMHLSHRDEISLIEKIDLLRKGKSPTIPLLTTQGVNGFWFGQAGMLTID